METTYYTSPIGCLEVTASDTGIRSILYKEGTSNGETISEILQECIRELKEYFEGSRRIFDLPIDPEGTEFQQKVWAELLNIPFGETRSYLEVAAKLGDPNAVRAIGHANGQNKINIVVPCHRVIGSNRKLTGYGGGLWRKEWLLKHESGLHLPGLFQQ